MCFNFFFRTEIIVTNLTPFRGNMRGYMNDRPSHDHMIKYVISNIL